MKIFSRVLLRPEKNNCDIPYETESESEEQISSLEKFDIDSDFIEPWNLTWPPRSPDLNPCDLKLWGYLKDAVLSTLIAHLA
ncbi:hypothetical protein NPIL_164711 [Nephila pilipes]|uniref:Uncharacterized protein n=1 Tax=Nephila pilipes TaxID=299642 RepID=A0A8X6NQY8_NEPPI|nr:hypothetical protein NPIL_164711 [Nephila pilipes]